MAVPARPYDALYDASTYTVSGARDHYRQQTVAGGFMVERAPNYPTMFSELPHFPATAYRFKNSDKVPGFIDRTFHQDQPSSYELTTRSQPGQVNGRHQYKYFRRPLLAAPDPVIIKQAAPLPALPQAPFVEQPKSKTVGTQSDYRENEAQTTAWEPSYVIPEKPSTKQQALSAKYHCEGPELLKLRDLKFGDGLPPGLQEVRRIEKMREKRAFEASLPPLSDLEQLPLRQKMLEDWESKEWAEREEEILSVQDERLALLEQALLAREDEFDENTMRRVEDRKTTMLQNRSDRFATIQANRIKTMRQLIEARKYVEKPRKLHKLTIVEKYANFGSSTYAPVQRDGRFPDSKPNGKTIETEGFQPATLQGLNELESYLPAKLLNPRISAPRKPVKLNYAQRQDVAVQRDLKAINDLLDTAKASKGRGVGDCWPAPLKDNVTADKGMQKRSTFRNTDRPDTPVLAASISAGREAAAVLLQRLLRGRAAQNLMYEGKTRCQALIQELSLEGCGAASRPEDCEASDPLDSLIGLVISGLSAALTEANPLSRAEQLTSIFGPTMAPPRPEEDAALMAESSAAGLTPRVGLDRFTLTAAESGASRGPTLDRVETVVYEKGAQDAVQQAVYARANTMANTVVGAVAEEMAAAMATAVAVAVAEAQRISESGEAAAMAEAAEAAEAAAAAAGVDAGVGTEEEVGTQTAEEDGAQASAERSFGVSGVDAAEQTPDEGLSGQADGDPEAEAAEAAGEVQQPEVQHVPAPPTSRPPSGGSRPPSGGSRQAAGGSRPSSGAVRPGSSGAAAARSQSFGKVEESEGDAAAVARAEDGPAGEEGAEADAAAAADGSPVDAGATDAPTADEGAGTGGGNGEAESEEQLPGAVAAESSEPQAEGVMEREIDNQVVGGLPDVEAEPAAESEAAAGNEADLAAESEAAGEAAAAAEEQDVVAESSEQPAEAEAAAAAAEEQEEAAESSEQRAEPEAAAAAAEEQEEAAESSEQPAEPEAAAAAAEEQEEAAESREQPAEPEAAAAAAEEQEEAAESSEQPAEPEAVAADADAEPLVGAEPEASAADMQAEQASPLDAGDDEADMLGGEASLGHALHASAEAEADAEAEAGEDGGAAAAADEMPQGEVSFGAAE